MSPLCWSRGKSQGSGATTSPGCPYPAPRDSPQPNLWPRTPCQSLRTISFCPSHTTAGPVPSSSESCPAMGHTNPGPPVGPQCPPVALLLTGGWNGPDTPSSWPSGQPRRAGLCPTPPPSPFHTDVLNLSSGLGKVWPRACNLLSNFIFVFIVKLALLSSLEVTKHMISLG